MTCTTTSITSRPSMPTRYVPCQAGEGSDVSCEGVFGLRYDMLRGPQLDLEKLQAEPESYLQGLATFGMQGLINR
jgi:hypothetical protein